VTVRKLRAKQRGPKCSWCDAKAIQRGFMFSRFACADHAAELAAWDARAQAPDYSDAAFIGGFGT
jgi:hypothetical protein